jgi:hypothetical protein
MIRLRHKPDAMSLTMAAVEAAARKDVPAMVAAGQAIEQQLSAAEVFQALASFFLTISPSMKSQQKEIIRAELESTSGPDSVRAAVMDIGSALIIDCDSEKGAAAFVHHAKQLAAQPNLWAGVIWETVEAAGRACGHIGVTFNWKQG